MVQYQCEQCLKQQHYKFKCVVGHLNVRTLVDYTTHRMQVQTAHPPLFYNTALSSNWSGVLPLTQRMGFRAPIGLQKDVRKSVVRNTLKQIKCGKSYPSKQSCFTRLAWAKVGERFTPPTQHLSLMAHSYIGQYIGFSTLEAQFNSGMRHQVTKTYR